MRVAHIKGWRRAVASLFLLGSVGSGLLVAGPASASGTSTFCNLMFKYNPPAEAGGAASEKVWAKNNLKFIEKLEASAPNAKTKVALKSLVAIMKAEVASSTTAKLNLYVAKNSKTISNDFIALANSISACV